MFSHHIFKPDVNESLHLMKSLGLTFAAQAGHYSDELTALIRSDAYLELLEFKLDYTLFKDALEAYSARQALAMFQKADFLPVDINRERVAFQKFVDAEVQCYLTNRRLRGFRVGSTLSHVEPILFIAQRKIARILGDVPSLEELALTFGPGSSTSCRRTTTARWKLTSKPSCSPNMLGMVSDLLSELPLYAKLHEVPGAGQPVIPVDVHDGRLMFVPKNAKTDRSICVEPTLNGMVQRGVGKLLKKRLLQNGINLHDQTINQRLAWEGSVTNQLSTIDLASASDTISVELVRDLLPPEWFELLDSIRSSSLRYKGELIHLEKFSSMGNGYTFELESLIFHAICSAVCSHYGISGTISVYGDDLIVPVSSFDKIVSVFDALGFSVNTSKSYADGPFRESCGADYFKGVNVRPVYVTEPLSAFHVMRLHNYFHRSGMQYLFEGLLTYLEGLVPPTVRLYGPDGYGDGHFVTDTPPLIPHKRKLGWCGYIFETYVLKNKRIKGILPGDSVLPYYWIYAASSDKEEYEDRTDGKIPRRLKLNASSVPRIGPNPPDHYVVRGSSGYTRRRIYVLA